MGIDYDKIDKLEKLFLRADSVAESVIFWEKRCDKISNRIDELTDKTNLSKKEEQELEDLVNELKILLKRMSFEDNCVDEIEKDIAKIISNEKNKTKNKKD